MPGSIPIPSDLPDYSVQQAALHQALQQENWLLALEYLYLQCNILICPENLGILIRVLQALHWAFLTERAQKLRDLLFTSSPRPDIVEPPLGKDSTPPPPAWLLNWLLPSKQPRLSVCMIVRNGADSIEAALSSIEGLAWEIIIVDTGSTDQTRDIALAHKVRWYELPWPDDFAVARNHSLQQAQGDWILILDADEILATDSAAVLQEFLSFSPLGWNLFLLTQQHLNDRKGQSFFVQTGRLFRNHPELRFHGPIHEQVHRLSYPWYLYPIPLPAIRLIHHGYTLVARQKHAKEARNQRLLEKALAQPEYQTPYYWLQKGHLLMHQDPPDLASAKIWLERALTAGAAQFGKIPPAPGWSSSPLNFNLFLLLNCLFQAQQPAEMAYFAWKYRQWNIYAEGLALGGWALARQNQGQIARPILERFFEPGCPRLREDLSYYRILTLEGLLDCALAAQDPWLALAYIWQLQHYQHDPRLNIVEAQLLQHLEILPQALTDTLLTAFLNAGRQSQFKQQALLGFALLSLRNFPEHLQAELGMCLARLGYFKLAQHLQPGLKMQSNQSWPEPAKIPSEAQWYLLLSQCPFYS